MSEIKEATLEEEKPKSEEETIVPAATNEEIKEAEELRKPKGDILDKMKAFAKRFNGYPFVTCCMINSYKDEETDPRKLSVLVRRIRGAFILTGRGNVEDFKRSFVGAPIAYVMCFQRRPTMAEDGCYNAIDINGQPIAWKMCGEYVLSEPDKFKPFYIQKTGLDSFLAGVGDPYPKITPEMAKAVADMNKDEDKEKPAEEAAK